MPAYIIDVNKDTSMEEVATLAFAVLQSVGSLWFLPLEMASERTIQY
jgi:hypothetical protein